MRLALQLADQAAAAGEVPVGAVVVRDGVVIGTGRNSPIGSSDPSAHAEIVALRAAAAATGNYRLEDCTLYVTLEPCAMCSGGILHSRIKRVVFGAPDPKTGCAGSVVNLFAQPQLNHQTQLEGGVLAAPAGQLLADFFQQKRVQQRLSSVPLREDALRTADRHFESLPGYPWQPHYIQDLPSLAGLRLHYLDEGPADSLKLYLCLHPIPGWSHTLRHPIQGWLEEGARVLVPDLIGFGKSDKPKREDFHSLSLHARCLQELLERLDARGVVLFAPPSVQTLAVKLADCASARVSGVRPLVIDSVQPDGLEQIAMGAPFPDAGHRAAERAFAAEKFN
jgi:tRNA(adenine34) deaminase